MKTYLLGLGLLMTLYACNPLNKVLKDPAKLNAAGRQWEKSHPCVVDSVVRYLPGQVSVVVDSSAYTAYEDSLAVLKPMILDSACSRYQRLFDSLIKRKPVTIEMVRTTHDTLEIAKRDMRHEGILQDSVNYYTGQLMIARGEVAQAQQAEKTATTELTKEKAKMILWISLLIILLIGSHILRSYLKLSFL